MTRVDVVIVNWNAGAMLRHCLDLLAQGDTSRLARVIVVDNGSTDGSADLAVPGLDLIVDKAGANLGFGPACNRGAAQGEAGYILFLNPDVEVRGTTLTRTAEAMDAMQHTDTAVMGIRLTEESGGPQKHCARFPRWYHFAAESTGLTHLLPSVFRPVRLVEFDHMQSRDVDHVIGAYYCIRREAFEAVGGFDEDYFVYFEDLDLSRRVADAGWTTHMNAGIEAFHKGGGTSEQIKAMRLALAIEGRLTYARKHLTRLGYAAVWIAAFVFEPLTRILYAALRGRMSEFGEVARAYGILVNRPARRQVAAEKALP